MLWVEFPAYVFSLLSIFRLLFRMGILIPCYYFFPSQATRTLRIFLSHTVSSQQWQNAGEIPPAANFETGEGIPAWAFKIEGRLLEVRV